MQAIIDPSLIFTDINLSTQTDLFRFMADVLQQKKYIEKPFLKAVIQREAQFPTGMQLQGCGVAIQQLLSSANNATICDLLQHNLITTD